MCGRFLTPEESAFERYFGLEAPPAYFASFNVAPTQLVAVIRVDSEGQMHADLLRWGFQPKWARRSWINARSETVFTSKAFAKAARERRCLVPAVGWYEWHGEKAPKRPYVFYRDGFRPFTFVGIWTGCETEEGIERSFAILTRPAAPELAVYHSRMPLVLEGEAAGSWVSRETSNEQAQAVLADATEEFAVHAVSRYVNKPEHNDARCIEALEDRESDA